MRLKVWWIPQIPMKRFEQRVPNLVAAKILLDALADYDRFQFENNIKPDYCNAGGLMEFEDEEWTDWYSAAGHGIDAITLEDCHRLDAVRCDEIAKEKL